MKNLLKHYAAKGKYLVDLASTKNISPRKIKDTIAVFGVPRGGTTWLLEILSSLNDYKPIHEPFNINWFPMIAEIGINNRPYLDIKEKNIELKEYFTKIFSGQIPSLHPISSLNRLFSKPSRTTHDKSNLGTQKQLYKWKEILSDNQINDILKVAAWFNLSFYGPNAEPDYEKLKNWTAF